MIQELSILLIEDDINACNELQSYIESEEDLNLLAITNSSIKALDLVQAQLPDVIILDLELHLGAGNGLNFLYELRQLSLSHRPYILVTTNNVSEITFESARQLGADFILTKYESGYSAKYVVDFIKLMKNTILTHQTASSASISNLTPEQIERRTTQRIQRELTLIGISPKAIGFHYLTDAIDLTIQKPTPNLSRILASKYKKTDASIERAMQNAINRAWRTNDPEELLKYYTARIRSDRGVPTLMEFIYYYATKIKTDIE